MLKLYSMRTSLITILIILPLFASFAGDGVAKSQAKNYRDEGYRLQSMGDLSGALVSYQKAVQIDPQYTQAVNDLGVVYESLGDFENARIMYEKTVELDPDYLPAYTNLAFLYEKMGDVKQASYYWRKRYISGEQGDYWWEVSRQHLLKLGSYPQIRQEMLEEDASRLSRELIYLREQDRLMAVEEAKLHFDLGNNALEAGDYEIAAKEFRTVLSLNAPDAKLRAIARKLYAQAERLQLREQAYSYTKNALDYIENDDYLSAGGKLKEALTAVFRITQQEQ